MIAGQRSLNPTAHMTYVATSMLVCWRDEAQEGGGGLEGRRAGRRAGCVEGKQEGGKERGTRRLQCFFFWPYAASWLQKIIISGVLREKKLFMPGPEGQAGRAKKYFRRDASASWRRQYLFRHAHHGQNQTPSVLFFFKSPN